ncbi:amidophosphoribosyltransferase [Synechococcus sp. PCC 7502]|uniref:amidophosphoribosyltransferase n=1 Tax=Synechococcus sp. PCC 7502 TaxID=1173263 RepID=UPI00029FF131|nr:amidophosphoribosyltransferase [Synechococcus sp. PCC 7502]AFY74694.1 amidophosphoribosyltransferase [Synechococcus sp. PCC 7502]
MTESCLTFDEPPDSPEEACGVFGVFSLQAENVAKLTYFGLYALQHRGQESAGITSFDSDGTSYTHKDMGLVSQIFNEKNLNTLPGNIAIGHNRYSTTGSSKIANAQPVVVPTRLGSLALAHNGNLVNTANLRDELLAQGHELSSSSDSEGIAFAIAEAVNNGENWIGGITTALRRCQGAFSLVMATSEGIIGARDGYGIRPLVIGQTEDGSYVLSSETCGLDIIGAQYVRDVNAGELVWIDKSGLTSHQWLIEALPKLCVFEMIYFARPDSVMNGESLYSYRMRLGKALAIESAVDADLVIGVPDSGIPAAIGYSQVSGIPYAEGLIKNRYVGRTFIQPTQAMRESGIRMKLNPLKDVLSGKRVIVIDDSIVRGTTSRKLVQALRDAGATEVHMRISSPPVTHPCFYGIDTDSQDQLIAATKSVAAIAKIINVDSLAYLTRESMLKETNVNTGNFCSACFSGDYPIPIPDRLKRTKLILEPQL